MALNPFQIVKFRCGGIDVHKYLLVVTVSQTDPKTLKTEYHTMRCSGYNNDLDAMCQWIIDHDVYDIAMESTGKYWVPVANKLEEHGIKYKLVHPKYVKAIAGQKGDKTDSKFICCMHACDLSGPGSVILSKDFRDLRDLARRYWKLGNEITSEKNRYQNCMTVCNIGIDSVFADPFCKSARAVMKEVLRSDEIDDKKILSLVSKRAKNKEHILDAIHGSKITPDQRFKMADITLHLEELEKHRDSIFCEMVAMLEPYADTLYNLTSIPGIGVSSALMILAEIGNDMSFWRDGRQLSAWAGLTPNNDQSHGKKKSTRISKAGKYLKPLLLQCAFAAVKNPNEYFGIKYRRICRRRGKKKAMIAIMRMMLVAIYEVIKDNKVFKPTDYEEVTNPAPKKTKELTADQAISVLKNLGYDVTQLKIPETEQSIQSSKSAVSTAA